MMGLANKLQGIFDRDKIAKPRDLAKGELEKIRNFRKLLPIIRALTTEGMEERHLEKISEIIDIKWTGTETLNQILNTCQDLGGPSLPNGSAGPAFDACR